MDYAIEIEINVSKRQSKADIAALGEFSTSIISDVLDRRFALHSRIRPLLKGSTFVGSALPVSTSAGDNVALIAAIEASSPGDVLMVDGKGDGSRALAGELLSLDCRRRGIRALVLDGAFRDVEEVEAVGLPVWAVGITPAGPFKNGPGSVGFPSTVGGIVCEYGDVVVGDETGVVVIPRRFTSRVLDQAPALIERERVTRTERQS